MCFREKTIWLISGILVGITIAGSSLSEVAADIRTKISDGVYQIQQWRDEREEKKKRGW